MHIKLVRHVTIFLFFMFCTVLTNAQSGTVKDSTGPKKSDSVQLLKEVIVKGKVDPVKVKKDTIEYNAAAYHVQPNDRVSELIKQLPGVMIDAQGNVTSMGKTLTKIRVNGKDFFTGNIKEFIDQLPADLVSKVQIINDYGDQAAYTGVKTPEPTKMLNLVTKKGQNRGKFGNVKLNLGTNQAYGLEEKANLWQDSKQVSINSGINAADNGAGKNTGKNVALSYRNNLSKDYVFSSSYSYVTSTNQNRQQSFAETITDNGNIFSNSLNTALQESRRHQLNLFLQHKGKTDFLNAILLSSFSTGTNKELSQLEQTGLILQDQTTDSHVSKSNPSIQATIQFTHRFTKTGGSLSINLNGSMAPGNSHNYQDNLIRYYDPVTYDPKKDSVLNLLIDNKNRTSSFTTLISYNTPMGKSKEGTSKMLNLTYTNMINNIRNGLLTNVKQASGNYTTIDTLSNSYTTRFTSQKISTSYLYTGKRLDYELGVSILPNRLNGRYVGKPDKIATSSFGVLPIFNVNYHPSLEQTLTLAYAGNSVLPNFSQLQPLPDTRNLQNVIIGNPDLKPSVAHSGSLNYNYAFKGGSFLQLSANIGTVQNKVVSNTILVADTFNSLKQQTSYLNNSDNYTWGSSYSWSLPFANNKCSAELLGNLSYNKDSYYTDNHLGKIKGLNYSQGLNLRAASKWVMMNAGTNYSFSTNRYSLGGFNFGDLRNWTFTGDTRFIIRKVFRLGVQLNKTINKGYTFSQANPMILNMDAEVLLFKKRQGSIKLQAFDLLNQYNNQQRTVSGNTITDSRTNQLRRYFQFSFTFRLDQFGKMGTPGGGMIQALGN